MNAIVRIALALASGCALASLLAAPSAQAQSAQQQRAQKSAEIPLCGKNLGSIAVLEPETNWWGAHQLASPAALIKVFVSKSRCFTLVDRGKGMAAMQRERELASGGGVRGSSSLGKGQIKAADYVLVPDLVAQNSNASGHVLSGLLDALIDHRGGGAPLGGLNIKRKTADVVLTVTGVRSSEPLAMTEGHASRTDLDRGGGGIFSGGVGATGYANTEIGQVVTLAYLQAYTDLVGELGGLPGNASVANVQQAVTINKPSRLFATAAGRGAVVRPLEVGMMLYPTGAQQGVMWEVEDELGNKGWVSSLLFGLTR